MSDFTCNINISIEYVNDDIKYHRKTADVLCVNKYTNKISCDLQLKKYYYDKLFKRFNRKLVTDASDTTRDILVYCGNGSQTMCLEDTNE